MKKHIFRITLAATGIMAFFTLASCDSNDTVDMPSQKTITFENVVTPKDFVQSGEIPGVTFLHLQVAKSSFPVNLRR